MNNMWLEGIRADIRARKETEEKMDERKLLLLFSWIFGNYSLEKENILELINDDFVSTVLEEFDFPNIIRYGNLDEHLEKVREIAREDLLAESLTVFRTMVFEE